MSFYTLSGGGKYLFYYKELAEKLGIENFCEFHGNCEKAKVYNIISQSDFLVSASLTESAGITVQEAMLLGKPVLVTKSGGADSLVTPDTGIVIEKGSTDALVNGILKMTNEVNSFNSELIKEYAHKNFDIDCVTLKYVDLYKQILSKYTKKNPNYLGE